MTTNDDTYRNESPVLFRRFKECQKCGWTDVEIAYHASLRSTRMMMTVSNIEVLPEHSGAEGFLVWCKRCSFGWYELLRPEKEPKPTVSIAGRRVRMVTTRAATMSIVFHDGDVCVVRRRLSYHYVLERLSDGILLEDAVESDFELMPGEELDG